MFKVIRLYFKNRPYYEQRKRYMKLQKEYRKKLKKQAKEFCPWSGYYMHEIIKTMLEFYYDTYKAGDCCWSESAHTGKVARSLYDVLLAAEALEKIDELETSDLITIADAIADFEQYKLDYEKQTETKITDKMLGYVAYAFLEQYYTKKMYQVIGEHIWEWCD